MKKLLALLLILCCVATLFACQPQEENPDGDKQGEEEKKDEKKDEQDAPKETDISAFVTAIANTDPIEQTVTVSRETALGTLNGTYQIVYNDDGSSTINYSYEKFNEIKSGNEDLKSTVTGTVNVDKNGNYSGTISGVAEASSLKLALEEVKDDCIVEGNVLSVTVAKAQTEAVLGNAYAADVSLVLTIAQEIVTSFSLSYEDNGAKVAVTCRYQ